MSVRPRTRVRDELWWSTTTIGGTTYTYLPTGPPPTDSSSTISTTGSSDGTSPIASSGPSGQETWSSSSTGLLQSTTSGRPGSVTSYGSHTSHTTSYTTTFTSTSAYPVTTVSRSDTTFTSYSTTVYTSSSVIYATPTAQVNANYDPPPVCIGDGLDIQSIGLLSALIIPSVVGLILWALFALLRPRFRQVYGIREWFAPQGLRPKPLGSGFFAFLTPHVPLVPSIPDDVSNAGRSPTTDAELFPSDEQLSQRTLWMTLLIVAGWSFLGLAGALPLYLIYTPCLAQSAPAAIYIGAYSVLQDLSLIRLLQLLDDGPSTSIRLSLFSRDINSSSRRNIEIRLIILTVLAIVLALLPALYKTLREFTRTVAYRERWLLVHCDGLEMGWLSARVAPGFRGWGEQRIKEFVTKTGLSSSMDSQPSRNDASGGRRRRQRDAPLRREEEVNLEVDVQSLFSVVETRRLAILIDERDEILNNLEIAETRYIASFRVSTPDPSIATYEPPVPPGPSENDGRPVISHPKPLTGTSRKRRGRRAANPAYANSSLAPTSFVAPSQYYKLRNVQGINDGRLSDFEPIQSTFSDSVNSRIVGSRFQEVNRNSVAYGRLPLGSHVRLDNMGELRPSTPTGTSTPPNFSRGPNYSIEETDEFNNCRRVKEGSGEDAGIDEEGDWVDVMREAPIIFSDEGEQPSGSGVVSSGTAVESPIIPPARPRPGIKQEYSDSRRETFPLRPKVPNSSQSSAIVPPHLRLQPQQPFVRPLSGLDHDNLGEVYTQIREWRTRLKQINADINDLQQQGYIDIADGNRIKGWLLVGRGVRFIPGIVMIEGRSKEDIRWDVLQHERTRWDSAAMWTLIVLMTVILLAILTAITGLFLATAPDVAHWLPFLATLDRRGIGYAIVTCLVPAIIATGAIAATIGVINWVVQVRGSVSISAGERLAFKTSFWVIAIVSFAYLLAIGSVLFSMESLSTSPTKSRTVADGSIYTSVLALFMIMNVAIIAPGLLLLQPFRLNKVLRSEKHAITPRQRFRATYPTTYNATFAVSACVLAVMFASTFSLIFPLVGVPVVVLIVLTLIAHRYLVGYVYARTRIQSGGGLLWIWLLKRFATLLALQPLLLGLILLTRRLWIEGGILAGTAVVVIIFVEVYAHLKTRQPGIKSLSPITRDSLATFARTARPHNRSDRDEEATSLVTSQGGTGTRTRGSMASVLDMMSATLAVAPPSQGRRGAIPLPTETLDDLTATERAARTHPDAPPHLPPLPFSDHAEETASILYAPELIAPPPMIWLPNDTAGVAKSEAFDLQKYHGLQVVLDVSKREDVSRPSSYPRRRSTER